MGSIVSIAPEPLEPLRFSVSVPMVSVEEPLEGSADFVAADPLDDGASFIRMRLVELSVLGGCVLPVPICYAETCGVGRTAGLLLF